MKKMLISMLFMACTVFTAAAVNVNKENGSNDPDAIEYNTSSVEKFDTICVDVPSRVMIFKGDVYDVHVVSASEYDGVEWHVSNGKLIISSKYADDSLQDINVRIRVITPDDSIKVEAGRHCEFAAK